jgi:GNAT superfamily N-acetyltransferase
LAIVIEVPKGEDALTEFVLFQNEAHAALAARWAANLPLHLPLLTGESPYARDREIHPLVARENGKILARAAAVVDHRYLRHWNERLGHIVLFEALPDAREAVRLLLDEACRWLEEKGMAAARAGFGVLDFPFTIDAYEKLPPSLVRQNPAHYHVLLKQAGFETEKGMVDYKIRVRPELIARWESALESGRRAGFDIVPLKDVPEERRLREYTETWSDTFKAHWGFPPIIEEEVALLFQLLEPFGLLETSVLAYEDGEPGGYLFVYKDMVEMAALAPGRVLGVDEKMNVLGIGVRERARGRGVNYAMASHAYLELIRRGLTYLSYTLVLDDNWPSRRTAEALGAEICANYAIYRRNFRG